MRGKAPERTAYQGRTHDDEEEEASINERRGERIFEGKGTRPAQRYSSSDALPRKKEREGKRERLSLLASLHNSEDPRPGLRTVLPRVRGRSHAEKQGEGEGC